MSEIWRHSEETARVQDYQEVMAYLDDAMLISVLADLTHVAPCSCPPYLYCSHKRALDKRAGNSATAGVRGAVTGVAQEPERHEIRERDDMRTHLVNDVEVTGFGSAKRAYVSGEPASWNSSHEPGCGCGCEKPGRTELAAAAAEEQKHGHPDGCGCEPCVALWWRRTTALARRPDPSLLRREHGTCSDCGWKLPADSAAYCYYCTIRRERRAPGCEHGKAEQCPACYRPPRVRVRFSRQYRCACLALAGFGVAFVLAGLHAYIPLVLAAAVLGLLALTGVRP